MQVRIALLAPRLQVASILIELAPGYLFAGTMTVQGRVAQLNAALKLRQVSVARLAVEAETDAPVLCFPPATASFGVMADGQQVGVEALARQPLARRIEGFFSGRVKLFEDEAGKTNIYRHVLNQFQA